MIPLINQALVMGYTAAQVLGFLSNKIPNLAKGIQQSKARGYSDQDVLKFLASKIPVSNKVELQKQANAQQNYLSKHGIKSREERQEQKGRFLKGAFGAGALAAGAMHAYKNYAGLLGNLLGAVGGQGPQNPPPQQPTPNPAGPQPIQPAPGPQPLPQQPTPNPPGWQTVGRHVGGTFPQGPQPTPNPQVQTPGQTIGQQIHTPGSTPNVPVSPQPQQQPLQAITKQDIDTNPDYQPEFDYLKRKNLAPKLQTMAKAGKTREQMIEFLKKKMPMMEQEYLRTLGPGGRDIDLDTKLGNIVDRFFMPKEVPQEASLAEIPEENEQRIIATKSGDIGEVKGADTSGVLLDIDGKVKKYKDEDLIESPLPEKDLADLYQDVIKGIEKEGGEVSRNVYWSGYDPKTNELIYIPHGGRAYIYDDISPEDAKMLTEMLTKRKTTGENYIGAWSEGTKSPIGAAMHQLIMRLQKERGGKGNEYKNRFETIYDALEPAKEALKRKHAKRKKKA